jgi:hypothetical protein
MKAEHRKELETNALADRMGRAMKGMKTRSSRTAVFYALVAIAAAVGLFLVFRYFQVRRVENSARWMNLEDGSHRFIEKLVKENPETDAGKAARLQKAWFFFWEIGLKRLGSDSNGALKSLDDAAAMYKQIAEDSAGDPVYEPEALYGLAAIEETRAVQNRDRLDSAKRMYEELAKNHPKSAHGKLAARWVENFADDSKRTEIAQFYAQMQNDLKVMQPLGPNLGGFKGFDKGFEKGFGK